MPSARLGRGWEDIWEPGEDGAHNALYAFLDAPVAHYLLLATFLHVATHRVHRLTLSSVRSLHDRSGPRCQRKLSAPSGPARLISFSQIGGRVLLSADDLFDAMPDRPFKDQLRASLGIIARNTQAWQMTGYPIVDAGMRELWQTGFMHNRVRMIVASF